MLKNANRILFIKKIIIKQKIKVTTSYLKTIFKDMTFLGGEEVIVRWATKFLRTKMMKPSKILMWPWGQLMVHLHLPQYVYHLGFPTFFWFLCNEFWNEDSPLKSWSGQWNNHQTFDHIGRVMTIHRPCNDRSWCFLVLCLYTSLHQMDESVFVTE